MALQAGTSRQDGAAPPRLDLSDAPLRLLGPTGASADLFVRPAYRAIIDSEAFERLRRIRFLGAIDYLFRPGRRHTRYDHSLAVAELALDYARGAGLGERDEIHLVAAALLHDIGHAPLSHSLEPVLARRFGIGHHAAGRAILLGRTGFGRSLRRAFADHGIDADRVLALIEGTADEPAALLFRSPINIDTIDGILRSYTYLSPQRVEPPALRVLRASMRRDAADIRLLDRFWALKDRVYRSLINSRPGALADYRAQRWLERRIRHLSPEICYWDERTLRRAHGDLFRELAAPGEAPKDDIEIRARRFTIDAAVDGRDPENDSRRYRQEKIAQWLTQPALHPKEEGSSAGSDGHDVDHHASGLRRTPTLF